MLMLVNHPICVCFFFFNDTATTEIYTLSLHDALPISVPPDSRTPASYDRLSRCPQPPRSEEHTSELQSHSDIVCRLLLEKKKKTHILSFFIKKTTQNLKEKKGNHCV